MRKFTLNTKVFNKGKKLFLLLLLLLPGVLFAQIAQRGSATTSTTGISATITLGIPTGLTAGDLMIATIMQSEDDSDALSDALLGDWEELEANGWSLGGNRWRGTILWKIADADDVAAASFTFSLDADNEGASGGLIAFSGVDNTYPFDVIGNLTVENGLLDLGDVDAAGITTITDNAAIVMLAMLTSNVRLSGWGTTSDPNALNELFDLGTGNSADCAVGAAWNIRALNGATGYGSAAYASGSSWSAGILLGLKEAQEIEVAANCQDLTVYLDADGLASITPADVDDGTSLPEEGVGVTWELDSSNFSCDNLTEPVEVTFTVTVGTISAHCNSTVTVLDTIVPVISCPEDSTVNTDEGLCSAEIDLSGFEPEVTENCNYTMKYRVRENLGGGNFGAWMSDWTDDPNVTLNKGVYQVRLRAVDSSDNTSATCNFKITVVDAEAPVFEGCPEAAIEVSNDSSVCGAVVTWDITATDNCAIDTIISSSNSGDLFPVGTTTVTLTATDSSGNSAVCTFDVVVTDTEAPVFLSCGNTPPPPQETGEIIPDGKVPANVGIHDPSLLKAENAVKPQKPALLPKEATGGVIVLNFEGLGNSDPINEFYNGGTSGGGYSGTDYDISFSSDALGLIDGDAGGSGNFANEPSPSTIMFFLGSDPILNVQNGFQVGFSFYYCTNSAGTVSVYDGLDGTGNLLGSVSLSSNYAGPGDPNGYYANWDPAVVAFSGTAKSIVFSGVADHCGFDDITFGSITPGNPESNDIVVNNDPGECGAIVDFAAKLANVTDNCGVDSVFASPESGSFFPVGETTVWLYATDIHGNGSSCSFTVTVNDTELPTIECPADIETTTDPGVCEAYIEAIGTPETDDNCEVESVTSDAPEDGVFPKGETVITWTVTDIHGNTATCQQTVTVIDDEAPIIGACGKTYIVELKPVTYRKTTVYRGKLPQDKLINTISDNCDVVGDGLTVVFSQTVFTPADWGTNTETVTVTDSEGNTASCTITVVVRYPLKSGEIGGDEEIDEPEFTNLSVYAYPNPTQGRVMLELYNYQNPDVSVQVMNITGQKVFEQKYQTQGWIELDLTGNKSGLYFINVSVDNQRFVEKIILKEQ